MPNSRLHFVIHASCSSELLFKKKKKNRWQVLKVIGSNLDIDWLTVGRHTVWSTLSVSAWIVLYLENEWDRTSVADMTINEILMINSSLNVFFITPTEMINSSVLHYFSYRNIAVFLHPFSCIPIYYRWQRKARAWKSTSEIYPNVLSTFT